MSFASRRRSRSRLFDTRKADRHLLTKRLQNLLSTPNSALTWLLPSHWSRKSSLSIGPRTESYGWQKRPSTREAAPLTTKMLLSFLSVPEPMIPPQRVKHARPAIASRGSKIPTAMDAWTGSMFFLKDSRESPRWFSTKMVLLSRRRPTYSGSGILTAMARLIRWRNCIPGSAFRTLTRLLTICAGVMMAGFIAPSDTAQATQNQAMVRRISVALLLE